MRADGAAKREAILDAALECFAKRGVLGTGIVEIGKRAKASPSSVYHQFGGIEDVLLALLVRIFEQLFADLGARVLATKTARAAVVTLVEAHLEWVLAHPTEARVMYQATTVETSRRVAAPLAARKLELLRPMVLHLAVFMDRGTLPRLDPFTFDFVVLGTTHEACRRYLAGAAIDPAWMRASLPAIAWAGLKTL